MAHHQLPFVPETMLRGILDAAVPPVLRVASGDTVALSALPAGGLDRSQQTGAPFRKSGDAGWRPFRSRTAVIS